MTVFIKKKDGTVIPNAFAQPQAESYLSKLVEKNRQANLKQALNDVFDDKGKLTGTYKEANQPVYHASAGVEGVTSVTLFYTKNDAQATIIAMGKHLPGTPTVAKYQVSDYGQPTGDFREGAKINI